MSVEPFDLFAIRYGRHTGRQLADNFIGASSSLPGEDLEYFVWVARRSDRLFVIDTGFSAASGARRGRTMLIDPVDGLARLGIAAAEVDDVIITHLHYDHAGALSAFPRARFHLQPAEIAFAAGPCMCHEPLRAPYDVADVAGLVEHLYAGRVHFHHGVEELAPGLSVYKVGGHSAGLQIVRIWTRRGWVVLASDATHFYANMRERLPFPIVGDVRQMLEGFQLLMALAGSEDRIVPGHDPAVSRIYPSVSADLDGIAMRLDTAPRPF